MEQIRHDLALNGWPSRDAKDLMATINIYFARSVVAASFITNTEDCSRVDQFRKIQENS